MDDSIASFVIIKVFEIEISLGIDSCRSFRWKIIFDFISSKEKFLSSDSKKIIMFCFFICGHL